MQLPVQVTFRGLSQSDALESLIREHAEKLDQFYSHIMSCRVVFEAQHRHQHQGKLYHVRIELSVPGQELVVSREQHDNPAHEDGYVVVRDAFQAARRQLEEFAQRRRRETKAHEVPPHGRVVFVSPDQEHGFIETVDGRQVYFHRNSVAGNGFDRLAVGAEVRFVETPGEEGPQASTVQPVGKHHLIE